MPGDVCVKPRAAAGGISGDIGRALESAVAREASCDVVELVCLDPGGHSGIDVCQRSLNVYSGVQRCQPWRQRLAASLFLEARGRS